MTTHSPTAPKSPKVSPVPKSPVKDRGMRQAFFFSLLLATVIFVPFLVNNKGLFFLSGDFNVQQIPFYQLAHRAVRSGDIFWNWYTDLGVNFIGSYSFYLLGSPFFWLTLPFPNSALPYLMAPLLILKTACAGLTSYCYLRRFVKESSYAVIGSVLYAFSGWMSFNLFFNHFHDVAVFFPLLLLAVELLVTEERTGWVAALVAVGAVVNYWFFIGEVVFVVLYVIVRTVSKSWRMSWQKFGRLAGEAVLGILLAAVLLLPSVLALLGNPRTGADRLLSGWAFWIYGHGYNRESIYPQRLPAILGSLLFPPELPAQPILFPDHGAKWASLSAWLPLFGLSGVLAYFNQRRWNKDWLRKMLGISLLFALIPGFNSLFILLNDSYYARWFYMPILLMALATVRALEQSAADQKSFVIGLKWTAIVTGFFIIALGLTPKQTDGQWSLGLTGDPWIAWVWFGIAAVGLLLLAVLVVRFRFHKHFLRYVAGGLAAIIVIFNITYIANIQISSERVDRFVSKTMAGREEISVPTEPFARSDIYDDTDNQLMFWGLPTIQTFHSIVPPSLMEFYPAVGVTRDVGSRPEAELYALRSLLSVRWLFIDEEKTQGIMPGYNWYDSQMGYHIYENEYYIPMGFTYDYFLTEDVWDTLMAEERGNLLLKGIYLDFEALNRHRDILEPLPEEQAFWLDEEQFYQDARARAAETATDFTIDRSGFSAQTNLERENLVFFSVPYEGGWQATVNGEPARIEKANLGFMAVRVPAGESTIAFTYRTPGLLPGLVITLGGLAVWGAQLIITRKRRTMRRQQLSSERAWLSTAGLNLSWDEYLCRYSHRQRVELRQPLTLRSSEMSYNPKELEELLAISRDEAEELVDTLGRQQQTVGEPLAEHKHEDSSNHSPNDAQR